MSSSKPPDPDRLPDAFSPLPDPWDGENSRSNHTPDEPFEFPTPPPPEPEVESDPETQDLFKGLLIDLDELLTHHDSRSLGRDPDDLETIDDNAAATLTQRISKFEPITPHSSGSLGTESNGNGHGNGNGNYYHPEESQASPPLTAPPTDSPEASGDLMDFFIDTPQPQEESPEEHEQDLLEADSRPELGLDASGIDSLEPSTTATSSPELSIDLRAMLGLEDLSAPLQLDLNPTVPHEPLLDLEALELPEGHIPPPDPEPVVQPPSSPPIAESEAELEPAAPPEPIAPAPDPPSAEDAEIVDFADLPPVEAPEATIALDDWEPDPPEPLGMEEPISPTPSPNRFESEVEAALSEFAAMIQPEITPPPAADPPTRKRAVIRKAPPPPPPRRPKPEPSVPTDAAALKIDPGLTDLLRRPVVEREDPLQELRNFLLNKPSSPPPGEPPTPTAPAAVDLPEPEDLLQSLGLELAQQPELNPTPEPEPAPTMVSPPPTEPLPAPRPDGESEELATIAEATEAVVPQETVPASVAEPVEPTPETSATSSPPPEATPSEQEMLAQLMTNAGANAPLPPALVASGSEQEVITQLMTKVQSLERQVYEPTEVINPLVPLMVQLLKMKVGTSQDMVRAMATPILDEMITERAKENREGMAMALSGLVPLAIEREIQKHPQRIAKAIGPEVAAAMQEQMLVERDAIAKSLGPTIGRAIKNQIELERDSMIDALYPVIGGTVNRYIGEAINTINAKVETAFSVDGLTRKVRARMQGVTEAELILQESIPVTVQAIFLIQKSSGLVIAEVQPNQEQQPLESNMVAGMLTAIRSFVNDCIAQSGTISELSEIEYGDARIVLEVAGYCYLAVVVKGSANAGLVKNIRRTLSQIIQNYGALIEGFEGDSETVPPAITVLLGRLGESAVTSPQQKSPKTLLFLVGVVALLIFMPWLYFQVRGFFDQRLSAQIAAALTTELDHIAYSPLTSEVEGGRVRLAGRVPAERFKEEASAITQGLAPGKTLDNQIQVVTAPPDPAAVASMIQLVTGLLNRNPGVDIRASYSPERVILTGSYRTTEDYEEIIEAFGTLPGIENLIEQDLLPQALARRIYFERDSAQLNTTEQMDKIIPISQFLRDNPDIQIRITGYVDASGPMEQNQELSFKRANIVKEAIAAQGIDVNRMEVVGTVDRPPGVTDNEAAWLSRCVRFELVSPEES